MLDKVYIHQISEMTEKQENEIKKLVQNINLSWKSKLHEDGTMFKDYFIVGINTPEGTFTYHYHIKHWDKFNILELEKAPYYDGHTPDDITRLYSILDLQRWTVNTNID